MLRIFNSGLLQSFVKSIMPAYRSALLFGLVFTFCQWLIIAGLLLAVVFSFAVFVLLRKVCYTLTICAMRSPVVLVVCLPIQWLNLALWGNGWALPVTLPITCWALPVTWCRTFWIYPYRAFTLPALNTIEA